MMAPRALISISMFYLLLGSCSLDSWVGALPSSAKPQACVASIAALCKENAGCLSKSGGTRHKFLGRHTVYSLRGGEKKSILVCCHTVFFTKHEIKSFHARRYFFSIFAAMNVGSAKMHALENPEISYPKTWMHMRIRFLHLVHMRPIYGAMEMCTSSTT
jgi:hypothetical protein